MRPGPRTSGSFSCGGARGEPILDGAFRPRDGFSGDFHGTREFASIHHGVDGGPGKADKGFNFAAAIVAFDHFTSSCRYGNTRDQKAEESRQCTVQQEVTSS